MKILMIGAHQDDNEMNCGGLALKLVERGHEVRFLSMSNGCGGHHILTPEETVAARAKESAAVAAYLGVTYDVWDIDDCCLTADLATRRRLIVYIREFAPDLIISHRTCDYHPDHRAVGQLVQDAAYLLIVPHECPQAPALRKTPVIMYAEDEYEYTNPVFRADYVFDIEEEVERKIAAIALNPSQVYEWLPYTEDEEVPEGEAERFSWRGSDFPVGLVLLAVYCSMPHALFKSFSEKSGKKSGHELKSPQSNVILDRHSGVEIHTRLRPGNLMMNIMFSVDGPP